MIGGGSVTPNRTLLLRGARAVRGSLRSGASRDGDGQSS